MTDNSDAGCPANPADHLAPAHQGAGYSLSVNGSETKRFPLRSTVGKVSGVPPHHPRTSLYRTKEAMIMSAKDGSHCCGPGYASRGDTAADRLPIRRLHYLCRQARFRKGSPTGSDRIEPASVTGRLYPALRCPSAHRLRHRGRRREPRCSLPESVHGTHPVPLAPTLRP